MKYFINLLILPLIFLGGGVDPAEGKVCFIIDPDGKCASGKVEKFKQDCSARGYTQTCTGNGQVGIGDSCDGKYKKCKCKGEYQYVKAANDSMYQYNDACTVDGVTKYKYKTCQSKYKYALSAIPANAASYISAATACLYPADLGNNICTEDMYKGGKDRSITCVCPSTYKYTTESLSGVSEYFKLSGEKCRGSDGKDRYKTISCQSGYNDTCVEDGFITVYKETKDGVTCKKCSNAKTCAYYHLLTEEEANARAEEDVTIKPSKITTQQYQLGNTKGYCYTTEAKTCADFPGYKSTKSELRCNRGYIAKQKYMFEDAGVSHYWEKLSCYKCELRQCSDYSTDDVTYSDTAPTCPSGQTAVSKIFTRRTLADRITCYTGECETSCPEGGYKTLAECPGSVTYGCLYTNGCYTPWECEHISKIEIYTGTTKQATITSPFVTGDPGNGYKGSKNFYENNSFSTVLEAKYLYGPGGNSPKKITQGSTKKVLFAINGGYCYKKGTAKTCSDWVSGTKEACASNETATENVGTYQLGNQAKSCFRCIPKTFKYNTKNTATTFTVSTASKRAITEISLLKGSTIYDAGKDLSNGTYTIEINTYCTNSGGGSTSCPTSYQGKPTSVAIYQNGSFVSSVPITGGSYQFNTAGAVYTLYVLRNNNSAPSTITDWQ